MIEDARNIPRVNSTDYSVAHEFRTAILFLLSLVVLIGMTIVVGQRVALPVFVALYLVVWGRCKWHFALIYAAIGWLLLEFMFDKVVHVLWYSSLLFG